MLSGNDLEPQHCTTTYQLVATTLPCFLVPSFIEMFKGLLLPDSKQLVQLLC